MTELSCNVDGYGWSIFLHKDRNSPLKMGPLWDWDITFGKGAAHGSHGVTGWLWEAFHQPLYTWYARMFEDPDFLQAYIDRWAELRQSVLSETNLVQLIDSLSIKSREALARNYQRWPLLLKVDKEDKVGPTSYGEELAVLKEWILGRIAWIDKQGLPAPSVTLLQKQSHRWLEVVPSIGTTYYTVDGTDPRMPGGVVSPRAIPYTKPFEHGSGDELFLRTKSPFGLWSPPKRIRANMDRVGKD